MIETVQRLLESIYGTRSEVRAADFVVDAAQAAELGARPRAREEVLVSHTGDDLELALYLDEKLLKRVSNFERAPQVAVEQRLGDFCEVTEGVSHFMYLAHTADQGRRVSLLELEAQAEVDKFALCTMLKWGQGVSRWAQGLVSRLFNRVSFHGHLQPEERWRYSEANRLAKQYCGRLMPLIQPGGTEKLLRELRHSYRLGADAKLAHLARSRD